MNKIIYPNLDLTKNSFLHLTYQKQQTKDSNSKRKTNLERRSA